MALDVWYDCHSLPLPLATEFLLKLTSLHVRRRPVSWRVRAFTCFQATLCPDDTTTIDIRHVSYMISLGPTQRAPPGGEFRTLFERMPLCTEKQALAAVYILTNATMYHEAGARRCVYFNPQREGMQREYCCAAKNMGAAWERCQIHPSASKSVVLVFHNGGLKAALNTKV